MLGPRRSKTVPRGQLNIGYEIMLSDACSDERRAVNTEESVSVEVPDRQYVDVSAAAISRSRLI